MARSEQDAVETFMSITGATELVALQKLEEHGGDLNQAVNDYFNEGERITEQRDITDHENHFTDVDDAIENETRPSLFAGSSLHPFLLLDPSFVADLFGRRGGPHIRGPGTMVSHPREVRESPVESKAGDGQSGHSRTSPAVEGISSRAAIRGRRTYGNVRIGDGDVVVQASSAQAQSGVTDVSTHSASVDRFPEPSAPLLIDDQNNVEDEMLRAAIEASKQDTNNETQYSFGDDIVGSSHQTLFVSDDPDLAHAVALSLKTAEQEKTLHKLRIMEGAQQVVIRDVPGFGASTVNGSSSKKSSSRVNTEAKYPPIPGENHQVDDELLVSPMPRRFPYRSVDVSCERQASSSRTEPNPSSQDNEDHLLSDEWGGISSEERNEAIMIEAALFGEIPAGDSYRYAYPPDQVAQITSNSSYALRSQRPERFLQEQQVDAHFASLLADQEKEKEAKAMHQAKIHLLEEVAARESATQRYKQKKEEFCLKSLEYQQVELELALREASLPQEPASNMENVVTLLVRMPDGSRCGRRFRMSDKLHSLFNFIDVVRVVKPGTYRLVRPYPRRTFNDADKMLSFCELGLTSKQEALFLEYL